MDLPLYVAISDFKGGHEVLSLSLPLSLDELAQMVKKAVVRRHIHFV